LEPEDLGSPPGFPGREVDYQSVIPYKESLLGTAARRFEQGAAPHLKGSFREFCKANQDWLEDYALFVALRRERDGQRWPEWPAGLAQRDPKALEQARERLSEQLQTVRIIQFFFDDQWQAIRRQANHAGILIVGDLPIFVAHNSADVWAQPELFRLDGQGWPEVVAGVPADYFSSTGQRWGNPLYDWEAMRAEDDAWWHARVKRLLTMVNVIRLDHFRGFQAAWEIPAEAETALSGRWVPGPGRRFFEGLQRGLEALPFIAEDLGVITPDVVALRDAFQLPGMRVLQLAFEGDVANPFLPHNFAMNTVVYTGTHDNDTAVGWFESAPARERQFCLSYLNTDGGDIAWDLIHAAWASVAGWSLAPMQDVLRLGSEARMNLPSRSCGNWRWRLHESVLTGALAQRIESLNHLYGRE
jgi:4-alpha-glucanotransferase